MFAALGCHIYAPVGTQKFMVDDYKMGADNVPPAGGQSVLNGDHGESVRGSSFISTLPTMLKVARVAAHPNFAIVFGCYHFWSGLNKLEDLTLRPGRSDTSTQDVPDMPRELLTTRRGSFRSSVTPLTHSTEARREGL